MEEDPERCREDLDSLGREGPSLGCRLGEGRERSRTRQAKEGKGVSSLSSPPTLLLPCSSKNRPTRLHSSRLRKKFPFPSQPKKRSPCDERISLSSLGRFRSNLRRAARSPSVRFEPRPSPAQPSSPSPRPTKKTERGKEKKGLTSSEAPPAAATEAEAEDAFFESAFFRLPRTERGLILPCV